MPRIERISITNYQQIYLNKNQTKDGARFEWGQNYRIGEVRQLGVAGVSDDSLNWEAMGNAATNIRMASRNIAATVKLAQLLRPEKA